MIYQPVTAVWEITMGCNMRCKHCGSSCEDALAGELTTEEALKLCENLGKLGFQWITLSGGEPTTRKDWHLIAAGLKKNGVIPNMITNGWLMSEEIVDKAAEAGVNTIAISVDGLEETHDYIRKKGSFQRIMNALDIMKRKGSVYASVITTVNNRNISELEQLKEILVEKGVTGWQLQLGLPMGNMRQNREMIAEPHHMDDVINFAYDSLKDGKIEVQLADCIGYYNLKEIEVRKCTLRTANYAWNGCGAGRYTMGILHNGDILGCTSIRDRDFIEGNIREKPLQEIWEDPEGFKWNRQMTKDKLGGFCGKCRYGSLCLGGCGNTRMTMGGNVYSENQYCSYHVAISKAKQQLDRVEDVKELKAKAGKFAEKGNLQLAELALSRALEKDGQDMEMLNLYGFVSFMLENYNDAKIANEKVLAQDPNNAYANKGMGLSLSRLGQVDLGVEFLKKAVALSDESFTDPYYDLSVVLIENGRKQEAIAVIEEGCRRFESFKEKSKALYALLEAE